MKRLFKFAILVTFPILSFVTSASGSSDVIDELRSKVFSLNPAEIGISQEKFGHPVWGMVMETGFDDGSYSLVTLADGTTSLYLSTGGGTIGAGEHQSVRDAVGHYLTGAQYFFDQTTPTEKFPRPSPGQVVFYFLGFDGVSVYESEEQKLGVGQDALSNLFYAAHQVIAEIRKIEEQ